MNEGIIIFLLSMLPLTELRASIPLAISVYGMSSVSAFLWSVTGNIIVAGLIIWLIGPIFNFASKHLIFLKNILTWIFERTRSKTTNKYLKWGQWALVLFVAIPLPGTGVYTGALTAYLFGLSKIKSFILISLGAFIAGVLVVLITKGVISALVIF